MKKKSVTKKFAMLLTTALLIGVMSINVLAEEVNDEQIIQNEEQDYEQGDDQSIITDGSSEEVAEENNEDQAYATSGKCGPNVYFNYDEASKTVTISGSGRMYDRRSRFDGYWDGYHVETAIIKDGVTSISTDAFNDNGKLSSVSIPDSVTEIGVYAFAWCRSLRTVKLPANLEILGGLAFLQCARLESMDVPGSVKELSETFNASGLYEVTLHPGLEKVSTPFGGCEELKTIVLPDTVTEINGLIDGGSNMDIYIPASVTKMKYHSFKSHGNIRIHTPKGSVAYEYVMKNEAKEDIKWVEWNPTPSNPLPFNDVPSNAWYHNAVRFVYDNKIMSGTSSKSFSPNSSTTREMMVTIVYNAAGKPDTSYRDKFADVPNGMWYSNAVSWAVRNDITSGKADNLFGVGEPVTREQVAVFLYNFAKHQGKNISARADLTKFSDVASVSSWARVAMSWANAKGVINGSNGKLNPKGNATRAEIATMIMNYRTNI